MSFRERGTWRAAVPEIRQTVGYLPTTPPVFRRYGNVRARFQLTAWSVRSHPAWTLLPSLEIGGHGSVTNGTRRGVAIAVAEQQVMLASLKLHERSAVTATARPRQIAQANESPTMRGVILHLPRVDVRRERSLFTLSGNASTVALSRWKKGKSR